MNREVPGLPACLPFPENATQCSEAGEATERKQMTVLLLLLPGISLYCRAAAAVCVSLMYNLCCAAGAGGGGRQGGWGQGVCLLRALGLASRRVAQLCAIVDGHKSVAKVRVQLEKNLYVAQEETSCALCSSLSAGT